MFGLLKRRRDDGMARLYRDLVEASRRPGFYTTLAVPDTVEGRFDLVVLHCALATLVFETADEPGRVMARDLSEAFFGDMDRTLREMGIGDISIPKKMKAMAEAYFGRLGVYRSAMAEGGPAALAASLARNVYAGKPADGAAERLAGYAFAALEQLAAAGAAGLKETLPALPDPDRF